MEGSPVGNEPKENLDEENDGDAQLHSVQQSCRPGRNGGAVEHLGKQSNGNDDNPQMVRETVEPLDCTRFPVCKVSALVNRRSTGSQLFSSELSGKGCTETYSSAEKALLLDSSRIT